MNYLHGVQGVEKFESFHPDKIKTIDNQHNMLGIINGFFM